MTPSPGRFHSIFRAGVLTTALSLVGCQSTDPDPEANLPRTLDLRFQESAEALRPDSAGWSLGGEGGSTSLTAENDHPERFHARFESPRALGRDTVDLSLWKYGLRTAVLPYAGSGPDLVDSRVVRDQLARDLLVRHKAKRDADPKAYPADASGVRRVYAECLLSHEAMCPDAAAPRPVGMDSAALVDELCRELARRKLSFATQIQAPFFGWPVPAWKQVVIGRVAKGVLNSQDSATLFPTELVVRQKSPLAQVLRAGGAAVPMSGRFAWNTQKQVEAFVEIRTLEGKNADGFSVVIPRPATGDTSLSLDGRSSLRAGASVAAGKYQRTVGVRDPDGRKAQWVDTFLVAAPDTARLTRVAGASARTVAYDSAKVWVAWQGDPARFDSVWIDGLLVDPRNGVWGVWVEPAAGGKVVVDLRARTTDGIWIEDHVEVARSGRVSAPSLVPLPGCDPKVVPFDSLRATVGWQEDSGQVDSVWIEGVLVNRIEPGVYKRSIDLSGRVGSTQVMVVAKRGARVFQDTVVVERRADTIPPVISLGSSQVEPAGDSVRVTSTWVVSDNDAVDSVWIGGQLVGRVGNTFSRTWMVDTSRRTVGIQARDRSGNRSTDTLRIPRSVDSTAPVLVRMPGTLSRTVSVDTLTAVVAWKVTDDRLLKSVWIGDSLVSGQGNVYATQVPLALGGNVIRIRAMDAFGNLVRDSIVVERRDQSAPVLSRLSPHGSDTTVFDATDSLVFSWKVSDPSGIDRVEIDGKLIAGANGTYTLRGAVPYGRSRVRIKAFDAEGHVAMDSVLVERLDRISPRISLQGPARDTSVASTTDSVELKWTVTDNWAIKGVEIDRLPVAGSAGAYGRKVALKDGWNTFRIQALDSAGNIGMDSVNIYRPASQGLRLYRDLPRLADSVVNTLDSTLEVAYFATSPAGIDTMLIHNGSAVLGKDGLFRRTVPLKYGMNAIPVLAVDHDGNRKLDTVKVRRPDKIKPLLVRQPGTTDTTVDSTYITRRVSWKATDNHAIREVRINGTVVTGTNDIYSANVNLRMGDNYIMVVAFDSAGNATADTLLIKRLGTVVSAPSPATAILAQGQPNERVPAADRRSYRGSRAIWREDLA